MGQLEAGYDSQDMACDQRQSASYQLEGTQVGECQLVIARRIGEHAPGSEQPAGAHPVSLRTAEQDPLGQLCAGAEGLL